MVLQPFQKAFALLLTTLLLGMVFGIPHIGMSVDMEGHIDCPFMVGEQAICEMNVLDHIGALQGMFSVLTPTILILLAATFAVVLRIYSPPDLVPLRYLQRRDLTYRSLFKELSIGSVQSPRAP